MLLEEEYPTSNELKTNCNRCITYNRNRCERFNMKFIRWNTKITHYFNRIEQRLYKCRMPHRHRRVTFVLRYIAFDNLAIYMGYIA